VTHKLLAGTCWVVISAIAIPVSKATAGPVHVSVWLSTLTLIRITGVPKLSPSMYPFSISIDEHVPLNVSAGSFFSREGPIVHFPGVGQNIFAGGNKCGKILF